jgi:hypothetical protein
MLQGSFQSTMFVVMGKFSPEPQSESEPTRTASSVQEACDGPDRTQGPVHGSKDNRNK